MSAQEYRRRRAHVDDAWHFCANCTSFPQLHYETSRVVPSPLCAECQQLERRQMCISQEAYL